MTTTDFFAIMLVLAFITAAAALSAGVSLGILVNDTLDDVNVIRELLEATATPEPTP